MNFEQWIADSATDGYTYVDLDYMSSEDIEMAYIRVGHMKWILDSYISSKNLDIQDTWKDVPLYEDKE